MMQTVDGTDYADLDVCFDCVSMLAGSGESVDPSWCPVDEHDPCDGTCEESIDAHLDAAERNWPTDDGWNVVPGSMICEYCVPDSNDDSFVCEPWFSRSSCDLCGSTLGGNREHATAMRDHRHMWGRIQHSNMAGTPHRKCVGCRYITLDLDDGTDDTDDGSIT